MILFNALRPLNCAMAALAVFVGIILAGGFYPAVFFPKGILAIVSGFIICAAGMLVNDYFDFEIDRVNKPAKHRLMKRFSRGFWLSYSIILFAIGIAMSMFINPAAFLLAVANSAILVLYSYRLKRLPLVGNVSVSYLVASTFLYGGAVAGNLIVPGLLGLIAFFANTGREIIKTVEDVGGDKAGGAKTVAVVLGGRFSGLVAAIFIFVAVTMSPLPYLLGLLSINYIYAVAVSDTLFLASMFLAFVSPGRSQKLMKFAMLAALVAFLAGMV